MVSKCIFIAGCDRSGTTMLGELLGRGYGTIVTPESQFKTEVLRGCSPLAYQDEGTLRDIYSSICKHWRFRLWGLDRGKVEPDFANYKSLILSLVKSYHNCLAKDYIKSPEIWVDHTPRNLDHYDFLHREFQGAKFIHIVRDVRGIYSSFKKLNWGPQTPLSTAKFWINRIAFGLAMEGRLPGSVIRVKYEDILSDPLETIKGLFNFVNMDFPADFFEKTQSSFLPSYTKKQHRLVGTNPESAKIHNWRDNLTKDEIKTIEREASPMMKLLGYEPDVEDPFHQSIGVFEKSFMQIEDIALKLKNRINFEYKKLKVGTKYG